MTDMPARSATCLALSLRHSRASFRRSPRLVSSRVVRGRSDTVVLAMQLIFPHF